MNRNKTAKVFLIIFVLLSLFLIASNFIWLNPRESLFYRLKQYATYNEEDWKNNEAFLKAAAVDSVVEISTDIATSEAVTADDLYPVNINLFHGSEKVAEMEKIKNAHFEKLVLAKNKPSDVEAQTALVQFTQGELTDVIIHQKLNIKIGNCFTNPDTNGNYSCVSCMILLYNRDKKRLAGSARWKKFYAKCL